MTTQEILPPMRLEQKAPDMLPWYEAFDQWLLQNGWPLLLALSGLIVGVTLYLIFTQRAVPLALWLTYLVMP